MLTLTLCFFEKGWEQRENRGPATVLFNFREIYELLSEGEVYEAFQRLVSIRGVGAKIAAFFLRDVVDFYLCKKDREQWEPDTFCWLQPIDRWVRAVARNLNLALNNDVPPMLQPVLQRYLGGDAALAWGICKLCAEHKIDPIWFNQGAWFYASNIAGTERYLSELLGQDAHVLANAALRFEHLTGDRARATCFAI